jgi:hypothetical protein
VGRAVEGLRRLELRREQVLARLWGNRQPGPRNDPLPRRNPPLRSPNRKSMPPPARPGLPWGLAASRRRPSTPSQTLHLRKKKTSLASPSPNPLWARRRTRLRPWGLHLTPASPLSLTAFTRQKPRHGRLMLPRSFLLQTPEAPSP